jgi:hypothetical protein
MILTTPLEPGIDPAFERRLSFKVHFPFREPEYREQIWRYLTVTTARTSRARPQWEQWRTSMGFADGTTNGLSLAAGARTP